MNPVVKTAWLHALRSGDYLQARGRLRTPNGFCCLGVLCDLYADAHPGAGKWLEEEGFVFYTFAARNEFCLPPTVAEWAGLSSPNPTVTARDLAHLNDFDKTFSEIADVIEEHL